ncbi:ketopantoate reductase panE/ApbA domain-containing protein [Sarocladium implicatum]|nr:ketopantoate reductase panE/ApbA domain-containing protein [Sarocladium implicatum]
MGSDTQQPLWLQNILQDHSSPKPFYAWTPANLASGSQKVFQTPLDDLDRRIFILGIGNMGRLYASYLAKLPHPPPITLVVHRQALLEQWQQGRGIEFTRGCVVEANKTFDIEFWTDARPEHGPVREVAGGKSIKNLLITTKASAALPEADKFRLYLDETSTVAFAHNGMSKMWPPHGPVYVGHRYASGKVPSFISCITTHGVVSLGPFRSLHASPADAVVGPVLPNPQAAHSTQYLMDQITSAPHLDSKPVARAELWILQLEKLIVNSTINPLTAVLRCKNGVLFADKDGPMIHVMDRLLQEASQVLQALVNHPSSAHILAASAKEEEAGSVHLEATRRDLTDRFSQPRLRAMLHRVGAMVSENTSSMLQDVQAGKDLEIRDFNGWITDMAAYLDPGLDVRCHLALVNLVERRVELTAGELHARLMGSHA